MQLAIMQIKQCQVDHAEITYRIVDDGAYEQALVCAGGLGGTHLIWSGLVRALRNRYKIIIWDYPGLSAGHAAKKSVSVDVPSLARYQRAVLDAEELEQVTLMGWSLGAQVAIESACRYPQRIVALVSICGLAGRPFLKSSAADPISAALAVKRNLPVAVNWLSERLDRIETLRAMLRRIEHPTRWAKRLGLVDEIVDDLIFDAVIRDFLALDTDTYRRYVQASADHDATEMLADFAFPVLAVAGQRDRFLSAARVREMAVRIPRAEFFEVRGATHFLPLEYFELLALKIDNFIKGTGQSGE